MLESNTANLSSIFSRFAVWEKPKLLRLLVLCSAIILYAVLIMLLIDADEKFLAMILVVAGMLISTIMLPAKYLIYATIFYFPFETLILKLTPPALAPIIRYGIEIVFVIALFALLYRNKGKGLSFVPSIDLPIILFFGVCILSGLVNQVPTKTFIFGIRAFFKYVPLYLLIANARLTRDDVRNITFLLILVAFIEVLIGISESIFGAPVSKFFLPSSLMFSLGDTQMLVGDAGQWASERFNVFGTLLRYNDFGMFSSLFFLFFIGLYFSKLRNLRRTVLLFIPIGLLGVFLSSSRTGIIGIIAGTLVATYLARAKKTFLASAIVSMVVLLVITILLSTIGMTASTNTHTEIDAFTRIINILQPERLQPLPNSNFRMYLIFNIGQKFLANWPFFGMGIGTFASALSKPECSSFYFNLGIRESWLNYVSDVEFITILGQTGVFGLLAFLGLFFGVFLSAKSLLTKTDDRLIYGIGLGISSTIVAMLIFCATSAFFERRYFAQYFWLFSGIIATLINMSNKQGKGQLTVNSGIQK